MQESQLDNLEPSKAQKLIQRISAIAILALAGLFLLLAGVVAVLPNILTVLAATILLACCLIFLVSGIVGKNPVSIWIALAFFTPFLIEILTSLYVVTYAQIYPLYIATPAIASLITGAIWRNLKLHLFAIVFFGGMAILFSIQSIGLLNTAGFSPWALVLPLAGALLMGCIVWVAVKLTRKK